MACDPRTVHSFRHERDAVASQVRDVRDSLEQAEIWHLVEEHHTSAAQLHLMDLLWKALHSLTASGEFWTRPFDRPAHDRRGPSLSELGSS